MSDAIKKPTDFDGWRARDAYDMGYRHGLESAADEIELLRGAITEALDLCSGIRCDEHDEEPCPWCLTEILTNALEGNDR